MVSPVRQDGVRYVMPCILALCVMTAGGFDAIAGRLRAKQAFTSFAGVLALHFAHTLARSAPYHLDYFNELAGTAGAIAESKRLETAWWGEGLDRAIDYVNANAPPGARVHRECVAPAHLTWFVPRAGQADWIVVYAPATARCPLPLDAREVYQVTHHGLVLAAVYRRR
jgi:hypothetical protein